LNSFTKKGKILFTKRTRSSAYKKRMLIKISSCRFENEFVAIFTSIYHVEGYLLSSSFIALIAFL